MTGYSNNQLSAAAATPTWTAGVAGSPLGFQQLDATDLETAQLLTPPAGANLAQITLEAGDVRWRDDGVAPTADIGVLFLATNNSMTYSAALNQIQFIAAANSPILNISYYQ
jgi:hypothetical protein